MRRQGSEVEWGRPEDSDFPGLGRNPSPFVVDGAGGSSGSDHPFKVSMADAVKVNVRFGQVNSVTPTIGGTALNNTTPPELTVATGLVYLAVILNSSGVITSASIHNDTALPAADGTHGYITLAEVTVSGGAITSIEQSVSHSLQHRLCGVNDHHFWGV